MKDMWEWLHAYHRCGDRSLLPTKGTLSSLATYASFEDFTAYPSQRLLADHMGTDLRTVRRHLQAAREAGWIEVIGSRGRNNVYSFRIPDTNRGQECPQVRTEVSSDVGQQCPMYEGSDAPLTNKGTIHGTNHGSITTEVVSKGSPFVDDDGAPSGDNSANITTIQNDEDTAALHFQPCDYIARDLYEAMLAYAETDMDIVSVSPQELATRAGLTAGEMESAYFLLTKVYKLVGTEDFGGQEYPVILHRLDEAVL